VGDGALGLIADEQIGGHQEPRRELQDVARRQVGQVAKGQVPSPKKPKWTTRVGIKVGSRNSPGVRIELPN
jgi:hypothetical protein